MKIYIQTKGAKLKTWNKYKILKSISEGSKEKIFPILVEKKFRDNYSWKIWFTEKRVLNLDCGLFHANKSVKLKT